MSSRRDGRGRCCLAMRDHCQSREVALDLSDCLRRLRPSRLSRGRWSPVPWRPRGRPPRSVGRVRPPCGRWRVGGRGVGHDDRHVHDDEDGYTCRSQKSNSAASKAPASGTTHAEFPAGHTTVRVSPAPGCSENRPPQFLRTAFLRPTTDGKTPAMRLGFVDRPLSYEDILWPGQEEAATTPTRPRKRRARRRGSRLTNDQVGRVLTQLAAG